MTQDHSLLSARSAGFFHRWRVGLLGALLLLTGAFLAACGSGGGSDSTSSDSGLVYVGLTDADGDFITYTVDVTALTLTRADGAVVNALPVATRVDFAQYTDMTEFLNAATVPSGVYTRVDMTLDFSNADIRVASGSNALAVTPKDSSGNPITTMTLRVMLDGTKPLVVRPGIPAHLTLDFDLEATNTVDLKTATVTVSPLLLADADLANPKVHRVRGPLVSVDPAASEFVVAIRPFHRLTGDFGRLTVKTDSNTQYEIDGVAYQGAPGLTQLDGKPQGTATVAVGNFNMATHTFLATEVYAGSSVAFGTKDVVTGSVIARNGNTLTVRGAALVRSDGTLLFNDNVTVTLNVSTKVTRQLGGTVSIGDISVGSRITALGTLTGNIQTNPTLDTTNGLVRIVLSSVAGSVNQIGTNQITVNLQTINGRPVAIYNFTGTGSGGADSNPAAYRIDTTGLSLVTLATNDPVRVRGFVVAYGQAVTNDFTAQTVIDLSGVPGWMEITWTMPQMNPFTSLTNQAMVTDITGSLMHILFQRGVTTTLTGNPTVSGGVGEYAIVLGHTVQLYGSFASFSNGLSAELAAAHRVWGVGARGNWDSNSVTLTSRLAVVKLQ